MKSTWKSTFLGDAQHATHYYENKYRLHHLKSASMQILPSISPEIFWSVMEETPHEKHSLPGDSKPSTDMAIGLFDITMVGCGRKEACSRIRQKYRLSFKPMQYKTLGMERKLATQYLMAVFRSTRLIMWIEQIKEMKSFSFVVNLIVKRLEPVT